MIVDQEMEKHNKNKTVCYLTTLSTLITVVMQSPNQHFWVYQY